MSNAVEYRVKQNGECFEVQRGTITNGGMHWFVVARYATLKAASRMVNAKSNAQTKNSGKTTKQGD